MENSFFRDYFGLQNQIAIVTGGMGKLGTEITETLSQAGARVAIFDLVTEPSERLRVLAANDAVRFFHVDVTSETSVRAAYEQLAASWGIPSILVNNAGWRASPNGTKGGVPLIEYPVETWEEVFAVNTTSAFVCTKIFGEQLIKQKRPGVVLNMASVYAVVAPDQRVYAYKDPPFVKDASYGASKAALLAFTRDLAVQWAPHNIRAVSLSPGGVFNETSDPRFTENYIKRVPLNRMATPQDVAACVLFLVSPAASYITGHNLVLDGGLSIW
ncbi:MAG TPA: SDR family oxidoreductase [Patescibacteria group bacterium]|nr:SDR family oxidoreductase [Patescibacteria group bacterium]